MTYTWIDHVNRSYKTKGDGEHLFVQVRKRGVTECARVVESVQFKDGTHGWLLRLVDYSPVLEVYAACSGVQACGGERCACAIAAQAGAASEGPQQAAPASDVMVTRHFSSRTRKNSDFGELDEETKLRNFSLKNETSETKLRHFSSRLRTVSDWRGIDKDARDLLLKRYLGRR